MKVPHVYVAVAVLAAGCSTDVATVDCGLTLTPTEDAICTSSKLRHLDARMTRQYRIALSISGDDEPNLRAEQAAWIRSRNSCGGDRACIAKQYRERLNILADYD
ncbi:MAG: lysozyme inhibitor LprI family protein [Hyphomicrobiaceae bacterium]